AEGAGRLGGRSPRDAGGVRDRRDQRADEAAHATVAPHVRDDVARGLAGAVPGRLAAAVDLVDGRAEGRQGVVVEVEVLAPAVAAVRVDGRVLEQPDDVRDAVLAPQDCQPALELPRLREGDPGR